ncbi:MAG: hypothetical protein GY745_00730 [Actinomycetia bacterium]|nr:hypothetical protein [Actinomycetes bacterium]
MIEDAGLANPTELAAYIGVDASTPGLRPLSGWGWGDWQDVPASDAAPTELTLVVASLALPTMAFMILTMQVGERRARRRSSVLASLDMASVTGRSVAVTESLVVGVLGCVSGMLAYHGFVHHLGGGSILPWAWWPRSGAVSMTERAIACLLVLGPLSLWPFVQAKSAAPVHTTRSALVRSIVRLIPLAAVLALSLFRTDLIDSDVKLFRFLGGASIAILLAATPLPIVLGATIERFVRGPLGLLVDGRIRTSTRTITWLGASVVCGTFIAIVSLVLMHDRSETLGAEAERAAAGWPSSTAIAKGHMNSSDLSTLESLGAERVLPVRIMQGTTTSTQASISVGIIDCGALGDYVDLAIEFPSCTQGGAAFLPSSAQWGGASSDLVAGLGQGSEQLTVDIVEDGELVSRDISINFPTPSVSPTRILDEMFANWGFSVILGNASASEQVLAHSRVLEVYFSSEDDTIVEGFRAAMSASYGWDVDVRTVSQIVSQETAHTRRELAILRFSIASGLGLAMMLFAMSSVDYLSRSSVATARAAMTTGIRSMMVGRSAISLACAVVPGVVLSTIVGLIAGQAVLDISDSSADLPTMSIIVVGALTSLTAGLVSVGCAVLVEWPKACRTTLSDLARIE